jgi:hypothetical protein
MRSCPVGIAKIRGFKYESRQLRVNDQGVRN